MRISDCSSDVCSSYLTGKPCEDCGANGAVNLLQGLGEVQASEYYPTSAPLVIDGVVLTNAFVKDNQRTTAPGGGIRAWDARSGALRWVWDSVPPTMHAVTADEIANGATLTDRKSTRLNSSH